MEESVAWWVVIDMKPQFDFMLLMMMTLAPCVSLSLLMLT